MLVHDGCGAEPVGIWSVGESEVWVGVSTQFIRITKNKSIHCDVPPLIQRDSIGNEWKKMEMNVRGKDLIILSGVVVDVTVNGKKEVEMWESTSSGVVFIWSVEEGVVKRIVDVKLIISTMIVVNDEVCFIFTLE